jgi:hypothetical protein
MHNMKACGEVEVILNLSNFSPGERDSSAPAGMDDWRRGKLFATPENVFAVRLFYGPLTSTVPYEL